MNRVVSLGSVCVIVACLTAFYAFALTRDTDCTVTKIEYVCSNLCNLTLGKMYVIRDCNYTVGDELPCATHHDVMFLKGVIILSCSIIVITGVIMVALLSGMRVWRCGGGYTSI